MTWSPSYYVPIPTGAWRDNRRLSSAAAICYGVAALTGPLTLLLLHWVGARLQDYREGADVDLEDAYLRYTSLTGLISLPSLVALVLVIVLAYRMSKNHQLLGRPGTTFGPRWAIAGWLIPLASVIIPYMQLDQLWRGSDPAEPLHSTTWRSRRGSNLIYLWWAAVLIGTVLGVVLATRQALGIFGSLDFSGGDRDYEEIFDALDDNFGWHVVASAIASAGGVFGALSVRALAKRQDAYAERYGLLAPMNSHSYHFVQHPQPPAGWHPDPSGRNQLRYWDGARWSEHVSNGGQVTTDPLA